MIDYSMLLAPLQAWNLPIKCVCCCCGQVSVVFPNVELFIRLGDEMVCDDEFVKAKNDS